MNYISTLRVFLSIDTEFTDSKFVSIQYTINAKNRNEKRGIIFNKEILSEEQSLQLLEICDKKNIESYQFEYSDEKILIHPIVENYIIENFGEKELGSFQFQVNVLFFYSCKDLEYTFGYENLEPYFTLEKPNGNQNWLLQTRSVTSSR